MSGLECYVGGGRLTNERDIPIPSRSLCGERRRVPRWGSEPINGLGRGKSWRLIVYVGIDLAKSVFAVHRVDEHGKSALVRPRVARDKLYELVVALLPWQSPLVVF